MEAISFSKNVKFEINSADILEKIWVPARCPCRIFTDQNEIMWEYVKVNT